MGRLFCGEEYSDIHLCNNICREFASRIMDSQATAIGTRNINPCVGKKKLLILASFEESLFGFV